MAGISSSIKLTDQATGPLLSMANAANATANAFTRVLSACDSIMNTGGISELEKKTTQVGQQTDENTRKQEEYNQKLRDGGPAANGLLQKLERVAATYLTIQGIAKATALSDDLTQTTARLDMMNNSFNKINGTANETPDLVRNVYAAAQDARGAFGDMASVVARFGNNAKDAFADTDEIVAFANLVQKQMTIAGASTQEAANAELQLSQALGSGVLRGDELNSIFEQAPNLIQNIADYLDVPIGQIREMASEGELSADVVKAAVFAAADDINQKFESMPKTFGQVATQMQNTALMMFSPVLQRMNDLTNSEQFTKASNGIIQSLAVASSVALEFINLMIAGGGFIVDHWDIIGPVIGGVTAALVAYLAVYALYKTSQLIGNGLTKAAALATAAHAAALEMESGATFAATAAQYGFNAALLACPATWVVLAIIALITVLYAGVGAFNYFTNSSVSATGIIMGSFATFGAFVYNIIAFLYNIFAGIANFWVNVWKNPIKTVEIYFLDLCNNVISYVTTMASAIESVINRIPGVEKDLTSGLEGFQKKIEGMSASVKSEMEWKEVVQKADFLDYNTAFKTGYSAGKAVDAKVSGLINPLNIDSAYTTTGAGTVADNIASAADNTGKIADSVDITNENLKYLKDLAETEVINRFTTAEIKVEQTNHNNINSGLDIDGVVTQLNDGLNEAIELAAEGVHD